MDLFGNKISPRELRRYVGNMDQVAGVKTVQLLDGKAHPARAALVRTGSGLEFTVMLDRCLDISSASFGGKAMGWRATPGDVAPQYYEAEGLRWLRSYFGGLVTTCGLTNVGSPAEDSAESGNGLHGRIGNIPAQDVQVSQAWEGKDYVLSVSGVMRETLLFGEKLALKRRISTKLGAKRFWIHDTVTNEGFDRTGFSLLYHCNIGWPAIGEGARVLTPSRQVAPRDEEAADGLEAWNVLDAPTHGYAEKVYFHDMAAERDGSVTAAIVNDSVDGGPFGVYVKYNKTQLPRFVQWKMMGEQDYVVGLEPCNCGVQGRATDEQHGLVHRLKPGESREFQLEFGAISTPEECAALDRKSGKVKTRFADNYLDFVSEPE